MKIYYISLGSFCYPKMIIRETNREYGESLPFDFNSSPSLTGITNILKELYETGKYEIELKDIIEIYNVDELCVSEKNMFLVHFFKVKDLCKDVNNLNITFPVNANEYIKYNVIVDIKQKFKKRFKRLVDILNNKNNILCFLRIENYDNIAWKTELEDFTKILSLFKNPNKYLIYSQKMIDDKLHFNNSKVLNYDYHIPILFCKHYFYDMEMINNKGLFINLLSTFEYLLNNEFIINIKNKDIIEKYYINKEKMIIYKLTNIKYFSTYYIDNDNILYINNVINGYIKYIKNKENIYELFDK
jgi:hypothetical protein